MAQARQTPLAPGTMSSGAPRARLLHWDGFRLAGVERFAYLNECCRALVIAAGLALPVTAARAQDAPSASPSRWPDPTDQVEEALDGATARLTWRLLGNQSILIFGIDRHGHTELGYPTADEDGAALDRLLGRMIEAHPDLPARNTVRLGAGPVLEASLSRRLLAPGSDWNPRTGKPRRGKFSDVLQAALSAVVASSPLASAFAAHGYTLTLDDFKDINVKPDPTLGNARVPAFIGNVTLIAVKGIEKH